MPDDNPTVDSASVPPRADTRTFDHVPPPDATADGDPTGATQTFGPKNPAETPSYASAEPDGGPPAGGVDPLAEYDLLGELGAGGMGVVYKARQKRLNRTVALKMLQGGRVTPAQLARFEVEARAVARLDHPNIVQIYDIAEHRGRPFFAMEYVTGGSLKEKLDPNPLPPRAAAETLRSLAKAMHYAHSQQVVHRDLKPANILLTAAGEPKVTDFGLAKQLDDEAGGNTRTGVIMGTPSYMAPEQAEGQSKYADHLADVYGLGATLYETITGRPPFQGPNVASVLSQVRDSDPVNPSRLQPGLARDLETICLKCLEKNPAKRYASAGELADDLGRYLEGRAIVARPVSSGERLVRWCRRNQRLAFWSGAAVTLAVAFLVSSISFNVVLRQKNADLAAANLATRAERDAAERLGDAAAEQNRYLLRNLGADLRRNGMARQRRELADSVLATIKRMERATATGAGFLSRAQGSAFVTLGDLTLDLRSADPVDAAARLDAARGYYDQAVGVFRPIADAAPAADLARANLANALTRRGAVRLASKQVESGAADLNEAAGLRRAIVDAPRSPPGSPDYVYPANAVKSLAESTRRLAALARTEKRDADAATLTAETAALRRRALGMVQADPAATDDPAGDADFRRQVAESLLKEAAADPAAARAKVAEAVGLSAGVLADGTLELTNDERDQAATALHAAGEADLAAGRVAEARDAFEWEADLLRAYARTAPDAARLQVERLHSLALYGVGTANLKLGDKARAQDAFKDCLIAQRRLFAAAQTPEHTWMLMVTHARTGSDAEAVRLTEREKELQTQPDRAPKAADFWFNAACAYSLCAAAVGGFDPAGAAKPDAGLTPPQAKLRAKYLADAAAALGEAGKLAKDAADRAAVDPDLEFLRSRPGHKAAGKK